MSEFIACASAKGGVGKTTLAVNLAAMLANAGEDVVLVDLNFSSPDTVHHLTGGEYSQTLTDVLKGHVPLSGAVYRHPSGVKLAPATQNSHSERLIPKLHEVLPSFVEHAHWVIADFPPRLDGITLNLLSTFDKIALVTTPDKLSVKRSAEMAGLLKQNKSGKVSTIYNMVSKGEDGIPRDSKVSKALAAGQPVVHHYPHSESSKALRKICQELTGIKISSPERMRIMDLLH